MTQAAPGASPIPGRMAIAGIGETGYLRGSDQSVLQMVLAASMAAITDAGLTPADVDGILPPPGFVAWDEIAAHLGIRDVRYTVHAADGRGQPDRRAAHRGHGHLGRGGADDPDPDRLERLLGAAAPAGRAAEQAPVHRGVLRDGPQLLRPLRPALGALVVRPVPAALCRAVRGAAGSGRRGRAGLPQPRAAQRQGADARPAADHGGLPGLAVHHRAAAQAGLLRGDRLRGRGRGDLGRAGPRPAARARGLPGRGRGARPAGRRADQPAGRAAAGPARGRAPGVRDGRGERRGRGLPGDLRLLHPRGAAPAGGAGAG